MFSQGTLFHVFRSIPYECMDPSMMRERWKELTGYQEKLMENTAQGGLFCEYGAKVTLKATCSQVLQPEGCQQ